MHVKAETKQERRAVEETLSQSDTLIVTLIKPEVTESKSEKLSNQDQANLEEWVFVVSQVRLI